jgi:hypothetical protein
MDGSPLASAASGGSGNDTGQDPPPPEVWPIRRSARKRGRDTGRIGTVSCRSLVTPARVASSDLNRHL